MSPLRPPDLDLDRRDLEADGWSTPDWTLERRLGKLRAIYGDMFPEAQILASFPPGRLHLWVEGKGRMRVINSIANAVMSVAIGRHVEDGPIGHA